jgi:hypothetical protein
MATTPIYGFVTPDLASTADGPTALAVLAQRVEREMTTFRATQDYGVEPNAAYNGNTTNDIATKTFAVSCIGYLVVTLNVNIGSSTAAYDSGGPTYAGWLVTRIDGVEIRSYRFHALWGTRTLALSTVAFASNTAAQTSRTVVARLVLEGGAPVNVNHVNITLSQFGAPGTG